MMRSMLHLNISLIGGNYQVAMDEDNDFWMNLFSTYRTMLASIRI